MKNFCLWLLLLATPVLLNAQIVPLRGTVTNENGEPLPQAMVRLEGTSVGALTDENGKFELNRPVDAKKLCVSYVEYITECVAIGEATDLTITLRAASQIDPDPDLVFVMPPPHLNVQKVDLEQPAAASAIDDPLALLQGRVPGLLVARPGSDPNEAYTLRFHGLTAQAGNNAPAIWVDGVPMADLSLLHPADIASIEVLPDLASAAAYGFGSAAGVILVKTKRPTAGQWRLGYEGGLSLAKATRVPEVGTASEFRNFGAGQQFGATTNWTDLIQRQAVSQLHHLSVSGGSNKLGVHAGLGFTGRQGILDYSNYQQLQGNVLVTSNLLHDRLRLHGRWLGAARRSNYSFPDVFRYAISANPTLPVRDPSNPAFDQFGGYGQEQGFDTFNPVALLEQSRDLGERSRQLYAAGADWQLATRWRVTADLSYQSGFNERGELYDREGIWRNGFGTVGPGRVILTEEKQTRFFGNTLLHYQQNVGHNSRLSARAGVFAQRVRFDGTQADGTRIDKKAAEVQGLSDIQSTNVLDFAGGAGFYDTLQSRNNLLGSLAELTWASTWSTWGLTAGVRTERESEGTAAGGIFPYIQANYNLNKWFKIKFLESVQLQASWGKAANYPLEGNWTARRESSWGLNFKSNNRRMAASVRYFNNEGSSYQRVVVSFFPVVTELQQRELRNQGWEMAAQWKVVQKPRFQWTTGANLSTLRSKLLDEATTYFTFPGAPGNGNIFYHKSYPDAGWGEIWSLVEKSVDADGIVTFEDTNKDGFFSDFEDYQKIGTAAPRSWLGWQNSISAGPFRLDASLRGAFNYVLVQENRVFYETPYQGRNRLITPKSDLKYKTQMPMYDRFVEQGGFWRLDDLRLTWRLPLRKNGEMEVYVGGQNLLTSTQYTGNDPEVRIAGDYGPEVVGIRSLYSAPNDPRAIGIDRRGTYWLEKTFYTGVRLRI